jgi:predicted TIM-barrel fold metal-dependent hydrolase
VALAKNSRRLAEGALTANPRRLAVALAENPRRLAGALAENPRRLAETEEVAVQKWLAR